MTEKPKTAEEWEKSEAEEKRIYFPVGDRYSFAKYYAQYLSSFNVKAEGERWEAREKEISDRRHAANSELLKIAAEVARGAFTLNLEDCRTIQDARNAVVRFDSKRGELVNRLKRVFEKFQKLLSHGPEVTS